MRNLEEVFQELKTSGIELYISKKEVKRKLSYKHSKGTKLSDSLRKDIERHATNILIAMDPKKAVSSTKTTHEMKEEAGHTLPRTSTDFIDKDKTVLRIRKELANLGPGQTHVYDDVVRCELPIRWEGNMPFVKTTRLQKSQDYPTGVNIPVTIHPLAGDISQEQKTLPSIVLDPAEVKPGQTHIYDGKADRYFPIYWQTDPQTGERRPIIHPSPLQIPLTQQPLYVPKVVRGEAIPKDANPSALQERNKKVLDAFTIHFLKVRGFMQELCEAEIRGDEQRMKELRQQWDKGTYQSFNGNR